MQVPEKLAMIGGGILLSSTLVFTLKSQASSILPKISDASSQIYSHIGDTQKSVDFDNNFQEAQKQGWQTGAWGSSKYYIDKNMNMHVGKGTLQGGLNALLGDDKSSQLKTLSIDQNIQAPQNSDTLFSTSGLWGSNPSQLTAIYGLDRVDMSQVATMTSIFCNDYQLATIEGINSWNVSNVKSTAFAFLGTSLSNIDISSWQIHDTHDVDRMFSGNKKLRSIDIQGMDTSNNTDRDNMFGGDAYWSPTSESLNTIHLGDRTRLNENGFFPDGTWKNGDQTLSSNQLTNSDSHPGTWVKQ